MRLIDADALTDEIMERYCKECDNRKGIKDGKYRIIYEVGDAPCRACPMDDMKDELDNAPTIEPEPKWIPCSKTTDIPDHEIMACDKYGEIMLGYLAYEDDQWICESDGYEMVDPIAWREKPEPYREEGEQP